MKTIDVDTLVIGAGPAGLAASCTAAQHGQSVALVDENPSAGGQIWRHDAQKKPEKAARYWLERLQQSSVMCLFESRIISAPEDHCVIVETATSALRLRYRALILATGARERLLPFPGWTLQNVMGAGGLQALVKGGLPITGKRVVISGSGPLLFAVAATLKQRGARIQAIVEQTPFSKLVWFALQLLRSPTQFGQMLVLLWQLKAIPFYSNALVQQAHGEQQLTHVSIRSGEQTHGISCDYLACGFYLLPNHELAQLFGCERAQGKVQVDQWQQTSVKHVYAVGELTGIAGLEAALVEGEIAGLAVAGQQAKASALLKKRATLHRYADLLARTFTQANEARYLPLGDPLVCRCEDVPFSALRKHTSWRSAKLHTRCGMGPCQGRICGAACETLFGWSPEQVQPPLTPSRISTLKGS